MVRYIAFSKYEEMPVAKKELSSPGLWYWFCTLRNEYMYYGQRCNTVRVTSVVMVPSKSPTALPEIK